VRIFEPDSSITGEAELPREPSERADEGMIAREVTATIDTVL
jgi:hypothetical protein